MYKQIGTPVYCKVKGAYGAAKRSKTLDRSRLPPIRFSSDYKRLCRKEENLELQELISENGGFFLEAVDFTGVDVLEDYTWSLLYSGHEMITGRKWTFFFAVTR